MKIRARNGLVEEQEMGKTKEKIIIEIRPGTEQGSKHSGRRTCEKRKERRGSPGVGMGLHAGLPLGKNEGKLY